MTVTPVLLRSAHAEDNGFGPRNGFRCFELRDAESTIGKCFRESALRRGAATAVVDGHILISYEELLERAETIARNLTSRHGSSGGVIAVCLPSSLATIESILGALLGGFAYFCLDPSLPPLQRCEVLQSAAPLTLIDGMGGLECQSVRGNHIETRGPAGVAALYATSGSTGEPKMVALSHRAILFDIGRQTNDLFLGPDDRFDSLFSFAFSASLATTFGALLNGAELHCFEPRQNLTILPSWLAKRRITISTMTVSMLRHVCLIMPSAGDFSAMRLMSVGGEMLRSTDVDAFHSVFPTGCVLQNAMASTETRTYAQYFVPRNGPVESSVSIGWPGTGKEVLLLDENGEPAQFTNEGEIAIRSRYLADGYVNDPQLTAIKFTPQPDGSVLYRTGDRGLFRSDGSLVFLGRIDSLAKIRGHRVELDQIAQVIELHPQIRASVVATYTDSVGNDRLIAYIVAHSDGLVAQNELREFLRERLPEYALPSSFVALPELPLNANFKVDRRRLLIPLLTECKDGASSAGGTAEVLRKIWMEVLECPIPDHQSFADLGGDSLSAVRVLVAISERLHCDLAPDSLHRFPTLKLLTECVDEAILGKVNADSVTVFRSGGNGYPFFFVAGLGGSAVGYQHLARHMDSNRPCYGLNLRSGFCTTSKTSVEVIAAEHVAKIEQLFPQGTKVVLVGYSFGGTVAFEMASQLRRKGFYDPLLVIIDMPAVNAPGIRTRSVSQRFLDVLRNLPSWTRQETMHLHPHAFLLRANGHLSRIFRKLGAKPTDNKLDPRIYFGESNLPVAFQDFLTKMYQAMRTYVPGVYRGKIILLRATVPTLFRSHDVGMGWRTVAAGGLEVHSIPGRHDDCMSERHSSQLAAVLERCAEDIEPPQYTFV